MAKNNKSVKQTNAQHEVVQGEELKAATPEVKAQEAAAAPDASAEEVKTGNAELEAEAAGSKMAESVSTDNAVSDEGIAPDQLVSAHEDSAKNTGEAEADAEKPGPGVSDEELTLKVALKKKAEELMASSEVNQVWYCPNRRWWFTRADYAKAYEAKQKGSLLTFNK